MTEKRKQFVTSGIPDSDLKSFPRLTQVPFATPLFMSPEQSSWLKCPHLSGLPVLPQGQDAAGEEQEHRQRRARPHGSLLSPPAPSTRLKTSSFSSSPWLPPSPSPSPTFERLFLNFFPLGFYVTAHSSSLSLCMCAPSTAVGGLGVRRHARAHAREEVTCGRRLVRALLLPA